LLALKNEETQSGRLGDDGEINTLISISKNQVSKLSLNQCGDQRKASQVSGMENILIGSAKQWQLTLKLLGSSQEFRNRLPPCWLGVFSGVHRRCINIPRKKILLAQG